MNSNAEKPLVSIGMGVYNAEQFLSAAIQSILDQDYPNIELIISDNGSRDRSSNICRSFAEKDPRIIYRRNERNINPLENWSILLELSSGVYHAWAADHDIYHPKYVSSLIEHFLREGDALVMAYADTAYIDINGKRIRNFSEDIDTRGLPATERFKKVIWGLTYCSSMYGLFRSSALKKAWKIHSITGPDRVFLPVFSLMGEYARHRETLFFMRQNRPAENHIQMIQRQIKWFVHNKFETLVPSVMRNYELIKEVHASNLENSEKEEIVEEILRWLHADPNKNNMIEVRNLVSHGMEMLNSSEKSCEEKLSAADEYLRIAQIGRIFRPEMGAQIDQLCGLCHKIKRADSAAIHKAVHPEKTLNPLTDTNEESRLKEDNCIHSAYSRVQSENGPLVSIGMTVYNQAPFLQKTIASLLAQEYQNFELIMADNASDDGSAEICEHYARQDTRIRLLKNEYNIGKIGNFDLVLNTSAGQFFLWSTGHDVYHPKFLSLLVDEFKADDDSVALYYPGIAFIDENDNLIQHDNNNFLDTRGMGAVDGFKKIIWNFHLGNTSSGLFRISAIKQAWDPYIMRGPDHLITAQLSLIGTIARVNDQLFYKRIKRLAENQIVEKEKYKKTFCLTRLEAIIPYTMFAFEHINLIQSSSLNQKDKWFLIEEVKKCFLERYKLQEEAVFFLKHGVEWLKSDLQQLNCKASTAVELTRLSRICMLFNSEYKPGFVKFSHLLENLVPN